MVLFYITCITPQEQHIECNFGDEDLETCFETLTQLVQAGWQLISVQYFSAGMCKQLSLPVGVFDGGSMRDPIKKLQREWEQLLL